MMSGRALVVVIPGKAGQGAMCVVSLTRPINGPRLPGQICAFLINVIKERPRKNHRPGYLLRWISSPVGLSCQPELDRIRARAPPSLDPPKTGKKWSRRLTAELILADTGISLGEDGCGLLGFALQRQRSGSLAVGSLQTARS